MIFPEAGNPDCIYYKYDYHGLQNAVMMEMSAIRRASYKYTVLPASQIPSCSGLVGINLKAMDDRGPQKSFLSPSNWT